MNLKCALLLIMLYAELSNIEMLICLIVISSYKNGHSFQNKSFSPIYNLCSEELMVMHCIS